MYAADVRIRIAVVVHRRSAISTAEPVLRRPFSQTKRQVLTAVGLQYVAAARTDLMPMGDEAAFYLGVVGNAAAEMHRVAAARGLFRLTAPILRECRRGRSADQRDNQDELASHDMPFWLRFRRLIGPGAVPPNVDTPSRFARMPSRMFPTWPVRMPKSEIADFGWCEPTSPTRGEVTGASSPLHVTAQGASWRSPSAVLPARRALVEHGANAFFGVARHHVLGHDLRSIAIGLGERHLALPVERFLADLDGEG